MTKSWEEFKKELEAEKSWWWNVGFWHKNLRYWIVHPWKLPGEAHQQFKLWFWRWYHRGKRGYSDQDTWGFDFYLANIIVGGVGKLKEWNHGHPSELSNKEWLEILTKIEKGFQSFIDEDGWFKEGEDKDFKEGMELFSHWFAALWD